MLAHSPAAQPAFNFTPTATQAAKPDSAATQVHAAQLLLPRLMKATAIDQKSLRTAMEAAFGDSVFMAAHKRLRQPVKGP